MTPAMYQNEFADGRRVEYLDALRGFTMLLVVYRHVMTFIFGTDCWSPDIIQNFRMPLFYFLSGFLCYGIYTPALTRRRLIARLRYQLLPTIITGAIFWCCFMSSEMPFGDMVMSIGKCGYWFTWVAFQLVCIYILIANIFRLSHLSRRVQVGALIAILAVGYSASLLLNRYGHGVMYSPPALFLSLVFVMKYFPFFIFGVLVKMNFGRFIGAITNKYAMSACGVLYAIIILFFQNVNPVVTFIQSLCAIVILFSLFRLNGHQLSRQTRLGRWLSTVGHYTLEIYLLHYFIIFSVIALGGDAFAASLDLPDSSWILQFIVYATLTAIIVTLCLLAARLLRIAPPLYRLLLGNPNK